MTEFLRDRVEPAFRGIIRQAAETTAPNLVKSLIEDGTNFTDDEMRVFMLKYCNK